MAAPTFVASQAISPATSTSPKTTAAFNGTAGDVLVVLNGDEADDGADNYTTTSSPAETWTEQAETAGTASSDAWAQTTTAVLAANRTGMTVSVARTAGTAAHDYGGRLLQFTACSGVGASARTAAAGSTTGTISITTTAANSAIAYIVVDFSAGVTTGETHATVNGTTPTVGNGLVLLSSQVASHATWWVAYIPDAGAAGAKTVGITAPTSTRRFMVAAVEIKGIAGGTPIAGVDTFTAAEGSTGVLSAAPTTDAAALGDVSGLAQSSSTTDAATVSDTTVVLQLASGVDATTVTDTTVVVVLVPTADAGTATDTSAAAPSVSTTDTATQSEATTGLAAASAVTDTTTVADASTVTQGTTSVNGADTSTLAELVALVVALAAVDAGTFTELATGTAQLGTTDTSAAADSGGVVQTGSSPAGVDTWTLGEGVSLATLAATTDAASMAELVTLLAASARTDTIAGTDQSGSALTTARADTATITELATTLLAQVGVTDTTVVAELAQRVSDTPTGGGWVHSLGGGGILAAAQGNAGGTITAVGVSRGGTLAAATMSRGAAVAPTPGG